MSNQQTDNFIENLRDAQLQNKDNIFSANHRMAMIKKYGYTGAEFITIEELQLNQ
jgi:hypothetical protein